MPRCAKCAERSNNNKTNREKRIKQNKGERRQECNQRLPRLRRENPQRPACQPFWPSAVVKCQRRGRRWMQRPNPTLQSDYREVCRKVESRTREMRDQMWLWGKLLYVLRSPKVLLIAKGRVTLIYFWYWVTVVPDPESPSSVRNKVRKEVFVVVLCGIFSRMQTYCFTTHLLMHVYLDSWHLLNLMLHKQISSVDKCH